jgi:hypothetical protein
MPLMRRLAAFWLATPAIAADQCADITVLLMMSCCNSEPSAARESAVTATR